MPIYIFPSLLTACFFSGLGAFVLSRNSRALVNQSLAAALFGLALVQFAYCSLLVSQRFLWTKLAVVGLCILPLSLGIFSLSFSRANPIEALRKWKGLLILIGAISLWFLYLGVNGLLITKTNQLSFSRFEVYSFQPAGYYFLYFLFFSIVFVLHNLENTYRSVSVESRWGIKFLVLGIFSASFFYIFLLSFMMLYRIVRVEYFVAEAIILSISGILIAFSLARHRLMDTDVFISRQVVYNSFVLFVVGAYLFTTACIGYLIKFHVIDQEVTQFLVAEVFMYVALIGLSLLLLSENIRHRVELYIGKHFYKHKYEYDEVWIAFTNRITSNISLSTLLPQLASSISEIVNTDRVYIFLYDEKNQHFRLTESTIPLHKEFRIPAESSLITYFHSMPTLHVDVHVLHETAALHHVYQEHRALFESLSLSLCVPLRIQKSVIGLLAIGAERTGEPYSYEDYDLMHTIGIQAAGAILNARLTENLSQARAMETFHKFAAFIIHDLKNATQNLSFVVQNAPHYMDDPEFREDAVSTIADTVNRMTTMITKLSSVPEKLDVHPVDTEVLSFVEDTLRQSKVSKLDHIDLQIDIPDTSLSASFDYQNFQSVLINLLSNAAESIQAERGEILLRVVRTADQVEFSVKDNGTGMTQEQVQSLFTPFKSTKKKGLGIGLYQCKTIVEAHKGTIHVESEEGRGTTFRIALPLATS
ncbi:PEP-CTERM system histidine kinase PrsK [candidate division KSB3 bacterium]|uniref:histidine kinase n=1 Tax=candidate division KSB3 bacterium TaxID=2044937 RepID=A0A2G6E8W9_9BACT|nr:MAG: PEP-CTERM system histidine kinase PrsK [candidate division KSB3 bacterium]PIE30607.1 MAG: PEP-CTERM system histidine kinase PrsK [candidate division KSB3 bacterium]